MAVPCSTCATCFRTLSDPADVAEAVMEGSSSGAVWRPSSHYCITTLSIVLQAMSSCLDPIVVAQCNMHCLIYRSIHIPTLIFFYSSEVTPLTNSTP